MLLLIRDPIHDVDQRRNRILAAQFACIALAFKWPRTSALPSSLALPKRAQYMVQYTIALVSAVSLLVALYRTPSVVPRPYRPGPRIVRAGIWTVHFGIDNEGRDSQRLMRDLVRCAMFVGPVEGDCVLMYVLV